MKRKDYILFDLDGTLTDPKEGITKSVQHALAHFGIQTDDLDSLTPFTALRSITAFPMSRHGREYRRTGSISASGAGFRIRSIPA